MVCLSTAVVVWGTTLSTYDPKMGTGFIPGVGMICKYCGHRFTSKGVLLFKTASGFITRCPFCKKEQFVDKKNVMREENTYGSKRG